MRKLFLATVKLEFLIPYDDQDGDEMEFARGEVEDAVGAIDIKDMEKANPLSPRN